MLCKVISFLHSIEIYIAWSEAGYVSTNSIDCRSKHLSGYGFYALETQIQLNVIVNTILLASRIP